MVRDSYFDPINRAENSGVVNELIAFAIRSGEAPVAYERLTYLVCDDGIDNPNRTIGIEINPAFVPKFGYTINSRYRIETITVGNRDVGGPGCPDAPEPPAATGVTLTVFPSSVNEGAGLKTITVTGTLNGTALASDTDVALSITGGTAGTGDYAVGTIPTLTIDAGATTGTAMFTFTPVNDSADENNETVTVGGSASDLNVNGATITIIDDDTPVTPVTPDPVDPVDPVTPDPVTTTTTTIATPTPGVTVSEDKLEIDEGELATYTIKLETTPSQDVTITVTAGGDLTVKGPGEDDLAASEITLAFNNTSAQTVTVMAGQDDDSRDDTATISHAASSDDSEYAAISVDSVSVSIVDDDKGVTVSPKTLTIDEGGSKSYTIQLDEAPSADVTIAIAVGDDLTVMPSALTFSDTSAQTVTVMAEHDDDTANDTTAITHTLSSDDSEYAAISVDGVSVTVVDDDKGVTISPGALTIPEGSTDSYTIQLDKTPSDPVTIDITAGGGDVTVSPSSLTFTDTSAQTVNVRSSQDSDKDDATASISHTAESDDSGYDGISIDDVSVTILDDDKGVTISKESLTINEGAMDSFTVKLDGTPTADVTIIIAVGGDGGGDLTVSPDSLTFSDTSPQTVTVTAEQDDDADDDKHFILHTASSTDGRYNGIGVDGVSVTIIDDDAGAILSKDSLNIPEGGTDTYTVKLNRAPTAEVTISMSAGGDLTVSPSSLTFTRFNSASPRTVTVTAEHDDDKDDVSTSIAHAASSSDSVFDSASIDGISVRIVDDDNGVTLSKDIITLNEGSSDRYTIQLDKAPTADVTITINGSGDLTVSPSSLTFSNTSPQTVTVTAGQDNDADDDMAIIFHTVTSADDLFDGIRVDRINVAIIDDDRVAAVTRSLPTTDDKAEVKGVTISQDLLTIHEGSSDGYTVKLDQAPSGDVTITIAAGGDVTVSPASLTFTKDNGTSAQKVNVTAGPDEDTDDDMSAISHTASSSDSDYDGINIAGISVTIVDSDRGVTVSQDSFAIDEGSTDTYTIKLDEAPTADVTITFSVSGDGDVTVSPGSLTFSDTSPQTVSVTAGEDDNADNETATISHTATSSDGHYSGISIDNIAVTIIDDDEEAIAVVVVPVTPTPTPTPTATPTPTPSPTPLLLAAPSPTPPSLDEPGLPVIGNAIPRVRNALGRAASAGRDRWPLVILLLVVLIGAGVAFGYLILRRR